MPDKSVDLVVTDPPYEIATSGAGLYKQEDKQYVKELVGMKDGFSEEILDELCRIMKKINIYLFCSQKQIMPLLDYFVNRKGCNWNLISWHKSNPIPACGNKYLTDTEFILFFREKGVKVYGSFDTKRTYYITPLNQKDKKKYGHPTCKPEEIVKNLIINSSNEGDIVLDCFMGSGTTGAVSVGINREFIGIELDEQYFNIAQNRINNAKSDWLDYLLGGVEC
jgi:DNA modification methylase